MGDVVGIAQPVVVFHGQHQLAVDLVAAVEIPSPLRLGLGIIGIELQVKIILKIKIVFVNGALEAVVIGKRALVGIVEADLIIAVERHQVEAVVLDVSAAHEGPGILFLAEQGEAAVGVELSIFRLEGDVFIDRLQVEAVDPAEGFGIAPEGVAAVGDRAAVGIVDLVVG